MLFPGDLSCLFAIVSRDTIASRFGQKQRSMSGGKEGLRLPAGCMWPVTDVARLAWHGRAWWQAEQEIQETVGRQSHWLLGEKRISWSAGRKAAEAAGQVSCQQVPHAGPGSVVTGNVWFWARSLQG